MNKIRTISKLDAMSQGYEKVSKLGSDTMMGIEEMDRIIKFRAWNKVAGFMIEHDDFLAYEMDQMAIVGKDYRISNDKEFIMMQFTGLKDNNGVEVFERDLIEVPPNDFIKGGIHQVYYNEDGFVTRSIMTLNVDHASKNSLSWIIKRKGVVIGNIPLTLWDNSDKEIIK